jgi:aldehyde:ferredoxin oxidoreductase
MARNKLNEGGNLKILRVNMTDLTIKTEEVPKEWANLGGRAMTSAVVAKEVDPGCHPLGKNNKTWPCPRWPRPP